MKYIKSKSKSKSVCLAPAFPCLAFKRVSLGFTSRENRKWMEKESFGESLTLFALDQAPLSLSRCSTYYYLRRVDTEMQRDSVTKLPG